MKHFYVFIPVFLAFALVGNAQMSYDIEKFGNVRKMHKSMVEVNEELLLKHDVLKLQIVECVAEVKLSQKVLKSEFSGIESFEEYYQQKYPEYVQYLGTDYFSCVLDIVYNRMNRLLVNNGFVATPKQTLMESPLFMTASLLNKTEVVYGGGALENDYEDNKVLVSTSGMFNIPDDMGFDAAQEFSNKMAALANANEAQGNLKIFITLDVDPKGKITLTKFDIYLDTWISAFKKGSETIYKWKEQDKLIFTLKKSIVGGEHVSPDGKINMDNFDTELVNILDDVIEFFSYELSDQLISLEEVFGY